MIPKFLARLQYLDRLAREGRYPSSRTILEQFDGHLSTVQRDIRVFRNFFKAPLKYDRAQRGYYYTRKDWRWIE